MPSCNECSWLQGTNCRAHNQAQIELKRPLPPPPIGACTVAIVEGYLPLIQRGHKVLEVGCGTWPKIRDHCLKVGATYEGLDVQDEYYGIKSIATKIGNLATLDYADETFDFVIGNQTMEHWAEHGCTVPWGLLQCFRVTKPGGRVFLNVPIHFHGTKDFLHGRFGRIKEKFSKFSDSVELIPWGNPSNPLPPFFPHPEFGGLANSPAYILDIRAVRNKPLPSGISNRFGFHGKVAQLFHYSSGYNLYRLKQKVRNVFRA